MIQVGSLISASIPEYEERKFQILEALGNGNEGLVYLVKSIKWGFSNDQKKFALKIQNNFKQEEIQFIDKLIAYQNQYENYQNNSTQIQPSNIIRIYEKFQWNGKQILVMEVGEQDLYNYISKNKFLDYKDKIKIALQISYSINFLHQNQQVHRDIKPENFIKVNDQFKLIDFGLTKTNKGVDMSVLVGTPLFQAPEILLGRSDYTQAVDIWSLACVFYELFSGTPIVQAQNYQQLKETIINCQETKFIENKIVSLVACDQIKFLLRSMFQFQFEQRIKIAQVIERLQSISQCNNILNNIQKPNFKQSVPNSINIQQNQQIPVNDNIQKLDERIKLFHENQQQENKIIQHLINSFLSKTELGFQNLQSVISTNNEKQISIYQVQINESNRKIDALQNDFKNYSQKQFEIQNQLEVKEKVIQEKEIEISSLKQEIMLQKSEIKDQETKIKQLEEQLQNEKKKKQLEKENTIENSTGNTNMESLDQKIIYNKNAQNLDLNYNESANQEDNEEQSEIGEKQNIPQNFTVFQKANFDQSNEKQVNHQNQIQQTCIEIFGLLQILRKKLFDLKNDQTSQASPFANEQFANQSEINSFSQVLNESMILPNIQEQEKEMKKFQDSNENNCEYSKTFILHVEKILFQILDEYQKDNPQALNIMAEKSCYKN
ncbi:unnamed protein product [Paramecium sonneborni]|uniref:non-specific serine/threonine protein kinase n=1 Tax=Paramecium sonneborni TaxID=65129 RepID=A0A8S1KVJ2_9CILI|nr:unnamed protein product [Paramecium sonneborni]